MMSSALVQCRVLGNQRPTLNGHASGWKASLTAQLVKNPPAMQETLVQFLGQEDSLEKGSATNSSFLGLPLWLRL